VTEKNLIGLTKYRRYHNIHYIRKKHIVDTMASFNLYTPHEILLQIALRAKEKRLFLNLSQKSLSDRSGVSFGVIKKFEKTGKISLESLLKLAFVLEALNGFADLFSPKPLESYSSLDQLLKQKPRRRGRK
jgi:hypothetical protein